MVKVKFEVTPAKVESVAALAACNSMIVKRKSECPIDRGDPHRHLVA